MYTGLFLTIFFSFFFFFTQQLLSERDRLRSMAAPPIALEATDEGIERIVHQLTESMALLLRVLQRAPGSAEDLAKIQHERRCDIPLPVLLTHVLSSPWCV